jgi:hypothetical protein
MHYITLLELVGHTFIHFRYQTGRAKKGVSRSDLHPSAQSLLRSRRSRRPETGPVCRSACRPGCTRLRSRTCRPRRPASCTGSSCSRRSTPASAHPSPPSLTPPRRRPPPATSRSRTRLSSTNLFACSALYLKL